MFSGGVGPCVLRQWHHLHLSMYGWLPQLQWTRQEHSRNMHMRTQTHADTVQLKLKYFTLLYEAISYIYIYIHYNISPQMHLHLGLLF